MLLHILERYVSRIERVLWNPKSAPYSVVLRLDDMVKSALLTSPEEHITPIVERFMSWAQRKVVTALEAALFYGKSRSTIYRWIKAGKLRAKKVKAQWQIILQ